MTEHNGADGASGREPDYGLPGIFAALTADPPPSNLSVLSVIAAAKREQAQERERAAQDLRQVQQRSRRRSWIIGAAATVAAIAVIGVTVKGLSSGGSDEAASATAVDLAAPASAPAQASPDQASPDQDAAGAPAPEVDLSRAETTAAAAATSLAEGGGAAASSPAPPVAAPTELPSEVAGTGNGFSGGDPGSEAPAESAADTSAEESSSGSAAATTSSSDRTQLQVGSCTIPALSEADQQLVADAVADLDLERASMTFTVSTSSEAQGYSKPEAAYLCASRPVELSTTFAVLASDSGDYSGLLDVVLLDDTPIGVGAQDAATRYVVTSGREAAGRGLAYELDSGRWIWVRVIPDPSVVLNKAQLDALDEELRTVIDALVRAHPDW